MNTDLCFFSECRIKMDDSFSLYLCLLSLAICQISMLFQDVICLRWKYILLHINEKKVSNIIFMNEWKIEDNCKKSY